MLKKLRKIRIEDLILHEDNDYIVVNKPPHLATLDDRHDPISIKSLVKSYWADAQVNHRIDKETSGVLVVAKHPDAYRHFSMLLEDRKVDKTYYAIVWGQHQYDEMLIEAPLEIKGNGRVSISSRGKYSATLCKTMELFKDHSLVACKPITGKKHQIRVHLSSGEAPIINDDLYGGAPLFLSNLKKKYKPKAEQEEVPLMDRFALHAKRIVFTKANGTELDVEAPFPDDFERVLKQLRKWGTFV